MKKLVTLKLDGDFQAGFSAYLTIGEEGEGNSIEISGKLPENTDILDLYESWRSLYRSLGGQTRITAKSGQQTNFNFRRIADECEQQADELCDRFNKWLSSEAFLDIVNTCRTKLNDDDEIRFLIRTSCHELQQLPWHKWEIVENYDRAEVAIGLLNSADNKIFTKSDKINILAILGNSQNINIEEDRRFLDEITDAKIEFLVEPTRQEISDRLWDRPWDILFFSGHSKTQKGEGIIHINQTDSLSLQELKEGLKKAIEQGLQLAFFNSCDGLGLARELQELFIPQVIVMKETVPDIVAQKFIKYFLRNYTSGKFLYQSVREARKRLECMEDEYPCASWLPVIGQNALSIPKTWNDLKTAKKEANNKRIRSIATVSSLILTGLVILVREFGGLQGLELAAYDQMMQYRSSLFSEGRDDRIVVITIDDKDIEEQKKRKMTLEKTIPTGETVEISLADSALSQLLQKLNRYQPRVIGLDIKRDFLSTDTYLQQQLATNQNLFVICEGKAYEDESGVASPPELKNARERIGFSDVAVDDDNRVRRYLWYARFLENSPCLPHQPKSNNLYDAPAFSFLIAKHYLAQPNKNIRLEFNEEQTKTGKLSFTQDKANLKQWQSYDSSPYKIDKGTFEAGFQVLLNYRNTEKDNLGNDTIASYHSLTEVLNKNFQPESDWLKDKIVLIGVTAKSKDDRFLTPFSRNDSDEEKNWGVYLHAHMISQIISAVEDSRPFLSTLSKWQEFIWIVFCGGVGILLIYCYRSAKGLILVTTFAMLAVLTIHIALFLNGWWIPIIPAFVVVAPSAVVLLGKGKHLFQDGAIIK